MSPCARQEPAIKMLDKIEVRMVVEKATARVKVEPAQGREID